MAIWLFYHHRENPVAETALNLLPRAVRQGWRVALRCGPDARADWWDQRLWLGEEDSFLAHGIAGAGGPNGGGAQDARQPILIGPEVSAEGRQALVLVDGAAASLGESAGLERVWVLFDGNDPAAVEGARALWRAAAAGAGAGSGAGAEAVGTALQYWAEEDGRWVMKRAG